MKEEQTKQRRKEPDYVHHVAKAMMYVGGIGLVFIAGTIFQSNCGTMPASGLANLYGDERQEIVLESGNRREIYFEENGEYKPLMEYLENQKDEDFEGQRKGVYERLDSFLKGGNK